MRSIRFVAVMLAVLVGLASCSRDPNVVKKRYLESGNKYFDKGRYKEASIQYRNALKRDQKYGAAYYKLALVSIKVGDIGGAASALRRAVGLIPKDQPDYWDATVKLSEIYLAFGRNDKGKLDKEFLSYVEKYTGDLTKRDANSFDAARLVGDLNFTKATEAYSDKHPDEGKAFLDLAVEKYRKADGVKPGQQPVLMQLARALAAGGNFTEAETLYRHVIDKDKTSQYAYTELYGMLLFQNKPAEAEQVLKSAFAANPKQFRYLVLLARHYLALRHRDQMIDVLNQIKSHAKEYDQAYLNVGDFYLSIGDGESAIKEYKEGLVKDPKRKATYQKHVIEVLMRQGKRSDAAEINTQILKGDPNDNDARGLAATFLLDKGDVADVAKALAELQAVVTSKPGNAIAHYNLGRAHLKRGEWEQARQQFQKAIELQSSYNQPRIELAKLQVTHGEYDAALKTAEAILVLDKGSVYARLIQSAALMGLKKFADSRALLDVMLKTRSEERRVGKEGRS